VLPAPKSPQHPRSSSDIAGMGDDGSSVHTQRGSSSSLAHRYCIQRADSLSQPASASATAAAAHRHPAHTAHPEERHLASLSDSGAASPSAGAASAYRSPLRIMPVATDLFARVQQRFEQEVEQRPLPRHSPQKVATAAPAIDAAQHQALSDRVCRLEAALASMAATVSQLVQLFTVAAESPQAAAAMSPQAAAAMCSTAAQLSTLFPANSSSNSSAGHAWGDAAPAHPPNYSAGPTQQTAPSSLSCAAPEAAPSPTSATSIVPPEFNLRRRIARVDDIHQRLCSIPSGLPAHEAVQVARH
jgi:hypothetical protein